MALPDKWPPEGWMDGEAKWSDVKPWVPEPDPWSPEGIDLPTRLRASVPKMVGAASAQCTDVEAVHLAADEIERLLALIEDGCKVFEHYDLPEHAFHYRRALNQQGTPTASEKST